MLLWRRLANVLLLHAAIVIEARRSCLMDTRHLSTTVRLRGGWFKRATGKPEEKSSASHDEWQHIAASILESFENDMESVISEHRSDLDTTFEQLRLQMTGEAVGDPAEESLVETPIAVGPSVTVEPHDIDEEAQVQVETVQVTLNTSSLDEEVYGEEENVELEEEVEIYNEEVEDEYESEEEEEELSVQPDDWKVKMSEVLLDSSVTQNSALIDVLAVVLESPVLAVAFVCGVVYLLSRFLKEILTKVMMPRIQVLGLKKTLM